MKKCIDSSAVMPDNREHRMNKNDPAFKMECPQCRGTGVVPDMRSIGWALRKFREDARVSLRKTALAMEPALSAAFLSDLELGRRTWTDDRMAQFQTAVKKLAKPVKSRKQTQTIKLK